MWRALLVAVDHYPVAALVSVVVVLLGAIALVADFIVGFAEGGDRPAPEARR